MQSFIEKQFPVSKVSKESYKERKAGSSQTLTGLGKWWGRKPLVLVRAAILGCLMPASDDPRKDMEIFLKIMSMDDSGLLQRKEKAVPVQELYEIAASDPKFLEFLPIWFEKSGEKMKFRPDVDRAAIENRIFLSLGYDQKIARCLRPEQLKNLSENSWHEINEYLHTHADSLPSLVQELSQKRYGRNVRVGDCFCGGGSIPFEAARMGCDVYASDLNPIAGLLTWADIHICGASDAEITDIEEFQKRVFDEVDKEITALGIEHNELGDRAVSYLYCVETRCPECGMMVPLAPTWVIGKGTKTIARLVPCGDHYEFEVKMGASTAEMKAAEAGTVTSKGLLCPDCGKTTPISSIRGDRTDADGNVVYGLRKWEKEEFDFRADDVYHERLYAIRYENSDGKRYYRSLNERDLENEDKVRQIVSESIIQWQTDGYIPSQPIEDGMKTTEVIRNRGWAYWHQLFTPRQLFTFAMYVSCATKKAQNRKQLIAGLLGLHRALDFNCRLCRWANDERNPNNCNFYNQALNTIFNPAGRSFPYLRPLLLFEVGRDRTLNNHEVCICDARNVTANCSFWITDPPYADAVNYHELSEFFLAWDKPIIKKAFPDWYTDSKRILAVKGDENFSAIMVEIYSNLANHMPDDGMQVVMFTHSDSSVWAQLALIMWKSGLRVCAAWNIATETDASGLKNGNYIKGTVLLVLRKQNGNTTAFLDELEIKIKREVSTQISFMQELDDKEEPNFSDPDYVLAAYAASLKVLTSYKDIEEIDLDKELDLAIHDPARSEVVKLIERAKKKAYDCIIPLDFDTSLWKNLTNPERFYIKGLEAEKAGNYQVSTYQEYARGFALDSYKQLMGSDKANSARLKTPLEFGMRTVADNAVFEVSTLRKVLAAIYISIDEDNQPEKGLFYLKHNLPDYWSSRDMLMQLLKFIIDTKDIANMPHWKSSAEMAELLLVLVENDHV